MDISFVGFVALAEHEGLWSVSKEGPDVCGWVGGCVKEGGVSGDERVEWL